MISDDVTQWGGVNKLQIISNLLQLVGVHADIADTKANELLTQCGDDVLRVMQRSANQITYIDLPLEVKHVFGIVEAAYHKLGSTTQKPGVPINDFSSFVEYIRGGHGIELPSTRSMLLLDGGLEMIAELSIPDDVNIAEYCAYFLSKALDYNADSVCFVRRTTDRKPTIKNADDTLVKEVGAALEKCANIRICDFFVVSKTDAVSMECTSPDYIKKLLKNSEQDSTIQQVSVDKEKTGLGKNIYLERQKRGDWGESEYQNEDWAYLTTVLRACGIEAKAARSKATELLRTHGGTFMNVMSLPRQILRDEGLPLEADNIFATIRDAVELIYCQKLDQAKIPEKKRALVDYLSVAMGALEREQARIIALDKNNCITEECILSEGTLDRAPIYIRELLNRFRHEDKCSNIICVHNHPDTLPTPSKPDYNKTTEIINCLGVIGKGLYDHIIVSPKGSSSMREMQDIEGDRMMRLADVESLQNAGAKPSAIVGSGTHRGHQGTTRVLGA